MKDFSLINLIVIFSLCILCYCQKGRSTDLIACYPPPDGVIGIFLLYDFRAIIDFADQAVRYDPPFEYMGRPIKAWLSRFSGLTIDDNRAHLLQCLHGFSKNFDDIDCKQYLTLKQFMANGTADLNQFVEPNELNVTANLTEVTKPNEFNTNGTANPNELEESIEFNIKGTADLIKLLEPKELNKPTNDRERPTFYRGLLALLSNITKFDKRPLVKNLIFVHCHAPADNVLLLAEAAELAMDYDEYGDVFNYVVFVVFATHPNMSNFTARLLALSVEKGFGVVSTDQLADFDAYVRICKLHSSCSLNDYQAVHPCYFSDHPVLLRTCVQELVSTVRIVKDCPLEVTQICPDPAECTRNCRALPWTEWTFGGSCDECFAMRDRDRTVVPEQLQRSSRWCVFRETKRCSPRMKRNYCRNETSVEEISAFAKYWREIERNEMAMIIIISGVTVSTLICLSACFAFIRIRTKEEKAERNEFNREVRRRKMQKNNFIRSYD